jgi:Zn-dependent protease
MLTQAAQRAIFRDPRPGRPLLEFILLALPVLIFSLVAHEYAHGFAALKQGDDTALQQGRLTLNPLPHIDPWLTVIMPALLWYLSKGAFVFGGAKPVQVRPDRYRNYRRGDIIVSSAGILTNLAITVLCALPFIGIGLLARAIPGGADVISTAQRMLYWGVALNLLLGFFNLIPIPPLDGSHVLKLLLPPAAGLRFRQLYALGFIPLVLVMWLLPGVVNTLMWPALKLMAIGGALVQPLLLPGGWPF